MRNFLTRLTTVLMALMLLTACAAAETAEPNDGKVYVLDQFADTPLDVTPYEGKALFLNFFTGWCTYCMQEMPEIKQVFEDYDPEQVAIVLVHVWDGENADDSAAVVKRFGLEDMILLEDEQALLASLVGLPGYPTSIFIDKDGYLQAGIPSALDYDAMASYLDAMGVGKREAVAP